MKQKDQSKPLYAPISEDHAISADGSDLASFFAKRKAFDDLLTKLSAERGAHKPMSTCPCCRYPTLGERGVYDICPLCNWEDDGQDDPHAKEVWGGPNLDYSLADARRNFESNLIMYAAGDHRRPRVLDNEAKKKAKRQAMDVYDCLISGQADELPIGPTLWSAEEALKGRI